MNKRRQYDTKTKIKEEVPPPNLFQVRQITVGEESYITFNYHPLLTQKDALFLAIWLIFFADWQWGKKHFNTAIKMLKEMISYAVEQQEEEEY